MYLPEAHISSSGRSDADWNLSPSWSEALDTGWLLRERKQNSLSWLHQCLSIDKLNIVFPSVKAGYGSPSPHMQAQSNRWLQSPRVPDGFRLVRIDSCASSLFSLLVQLSSSNYWSNRFYYRPAEVSLCSWSAFGTFNRLG